MAEVKKGQHYMKVADIIVGDRLREDLGDVEGLATSMSQVGLLHPIVVDGEGRLVAGERRYRAALLLDWDEVAVTAVGELDDSTRVKIEIEENIERKDFTWQEDIMAKRVLHNMKREEMGEAVKGHGGGWGLTETAEYLGDSRSAVGQDLQLAEALERFPQLVHCKNKATAWKKFKELEAQELVDALAEKVEVRLDMSGVVLGDARVEMKKLGEGTVDMVLTDPPFGKELEIRGEESVKPYEDDEESIMGMLAEVIPECYRVLREDRVMLLFFDVKRYERVVKMTKGAGFFVCETPLVYFKTGSPGTMPNESYYGMTYEMVLHCQKGRRNLNTPGAPNVYQAQRVAIGEKVHPTEKSVEAMKYFIEQHTVVGELVVDPFMGSGSVLEAGARLKRRVWGSEVLEEYHSKVVVRMGEVHEELARMFGEKLSAIRAAEREELLHVAGEELPGDFKELTPGTKAWQHFWRAHPELQEAMLVFQREFRAREGVEEV